MMDAARAKSEILTRQEKVEFWAQRKLRTSNLKMIKKAKVIFTEFHSDRLAFAQ